MPEVSFVKIGARLDAAHCQTCSKKPAGAG
jgi:hypothetical protein